MTAVYTESTTADVPAPSLDTPAFGLMNPLRVISAYAIIWIHTPRSIELQPTTIVARFAVPFFVASAVFFAVRGAWKDDGRTWSSYTWSRWRRLYVPFLAWTAIYLLFKAAKLVLATDQPNDFPGWELLLVGSAYHLWFLPFVFFVSIATFATASLLRANPEYVPIAAVFAVFLGMLVAESEPFIATLAIPDGLVFMWGALPAALWALALGVAYLRGRWQAISHPASTGAAIGVSLGGLVWLALVDRNATLENVIGMGLLVVALTSLAPGFISGLDRFAPLAYGIFLSHLLVIKVCESFAAKAGIPVSASLDISIFLIAAVGSTVITNMLRKNPQTRILVG